MKKRHLVCASLLLLLASCTSDETISTGGTGMPAGEGAVVFSLEGLGTGSVQNPETRAGAVLATAEENRIDSLDIYVFAYDDDGTFDEDLIDNTNVAAQTKLTPQADANVADNAQWYLQEKWTWKDPARSSNNVDLSLPQLHRIDALGGSGVARTAVIYPTRGRYLKFFIVANGGELTQTAAETVFVPTFTDVAVPAVGTKASDFLALRLRLTERPADPAQVLAIHCPLPMTAQMASTVADAVNMTVTAPTPVQSTRKAVLTRAVTRFDVINYAGFPATGDYELKSVIVFNHHRYTNLENLVPAASPFEGSFTKSLEGAEWKVYTDAGTGINAKLLSSAFYTSPTLAGTDPMVIGLRGVLGGSTTPDGSLLTPLNKDVKVMDPANPTQALVLKANFRYVLQIRKLGSDINVAFSILDWDSKVLDADFTNAPQPKLIWTNSTGITWNVTDTDMNKHSVTMANTDDTQRLAFELGTYTEDELADLMLDPTDPNRIPFHVSVESLNDNPAFPDDNCWLTNGVITFDQIKRDRFNVVFDVRPEVEVPFNVRPDLMVFIFNTGHAEKQLLFRVKSTWVAPILPTQMIINGRVPETVGNYYVASAAPEGADVNETNSFNNFAANAPIGWTMPTRALLADLGGIDFGTEVFPDSKTHAVTKDEFFQAFPGGKLIWLNEEDPNDATKASYISVDQAAKTVRLGSQPKDETYATGRYMVKK